MRGILVGSLLSLAFMTGGPALAQNAGNAGGSRPPPLELSTNAFPDGGQIPVKYTAAGESISPELTWKNVPEGTQSFVLHFHDLDVSKNKTTDDQVHWLVWDIPADATSLPEGQPEGSQLPDGSYQISATGPVYRGPGAPAAWPLHHYIFELYALDTKLDVQPTEGDELATRKNVFAAMQGHVLGKAAYGGLFHRPK